MSAADRNRKAVEGAPIVKLGAALLNEGPKGAGSPIGVIAVSPDDMNDSLVNFDGGHLRNKHCVHFRFPLQNGEVLSAPISFRASVKSLGKFRISPELRLAGHGSARVVSLLEKAA